jgi:hypothetical protein
LKVFDFMGILEEEKRGKSSEWEFGEVVLGWMEIWGEQ